MSLITSPRYLVDFHPKHTPHFFTDVLIIGSGLAGLRAAAEIDPRLSVLIVTKSEVSLSCSAQAQGGIAGVLDPEDRYEEHVEDTIKAGGSLCDEDVVRSVVEVAPEHIEQMIKWGTSFDREEEKIALGREGGHGRHRIAHAGGDETGKEMVRALGQHVSRLRNVEVWDDTYVIDLLTLDDRCRGAVVWSGWHGKSMLWAKHVILATGGAGQLYCETTNPDIATSDGTAIAYRAGVELRDMEFFQFHPTVLYIAGGSRSLISEATRGEGAHLVDRDGCRFMADYDERGELAPRDIVSQAIVAQMEKTRHPNVYLDMTHLDAKLVRRRFPGIAAMCAKFDLDITRDRIPVRPGAHYLMGGVTVDSQGRTSLDGLSAAGEVTSTGLHGANRLASNSLLEALVYGARAGQVATKEAFRIENDFSVPPIENEAIERSAPTLNLDDISNSLKSLMWRSVGVNRDAAGLIEAETDISRWSSYVLASQFDDPSGWVLQNMLTTSSLIIHAALQREESRGAHCRSDHPTKDNDNWNRHQSVRREE